MTVDKTSNTVSYLSLELLLNEIGGFGRFQIRNLLLICFAMFFIGVYSLSYVFTAGDLNYRCVVPTCDIANITEYNPKWLSFAVPFNNEEPEKCKYYDNVDETCSESSFNKSNIKICTSFVYETNEKTILNEWNLTCQENNWMLDFAGTAAILGIFSGTPFAGYFSDKYGRKMVFTVGIVACGTCGILKSFAWNYASFIIFEFLGPFVGAGVYSGVYILGIEFFGPKYRLMCGTLFACLYAIGVFVMGFIASMTQEWKLFVRVLYTPTFLFIFYHWLIPDSVRWLHSVNRTKKVVEVLKKAAATNNVVLSREALTFLDDYTRKGKSDTSVVFEAAVPLVNSKPLQHEYKLLEIFKYPTVVLRLSICCLVWMANNFVYFGLSFHAVSIGGNKYSNFMMVCLIEVPGHFFCWVFGHKIGRRLTLCGSLLLSGICCLVGPFLEDIYWLKLTFYLIGKFSITIAFSTIFVYTTEMFPTNLRHSLLATSSTFGKIGGTLATQTPSLKVYMESLPMIVFGFAAIISGVLSLMLPETLNKELPNTLEEAVTLRELVHTDDASVLKPMLTN